MNLKQLILEQQTETKEIIAELLDDGSDPEAIYTIEHHFYTQDIDLLERFAVEAFKQGFEVSDPEEIIDENDSPLICCDVISEIPLEAPLINQQIEQLLFIADKFSVHYDGWGTYFEGDEEDEDGDDDEYDEDEESDENGSDDGEDDDDDFDDDDDNEEIDFNRH